MPNSIRHVVGGVIGLLAAPIIMLLLILGTERLARAFQLFRLEGSDRLVGILLMALAAAIVGVLVTPWVSPLASIVPGFLFCALTLLDVASRETVADIAGVLPDRQSFFFLDVLGFGTALVLGVVLLVASIPPSRWTGKPTASRPRPQPQYGPPPQQPQPQYGPPQPQPHYGPPPG
jgi:hypothetical protein